MIGRRPAAASAVALRVEPQVGLLDEPVDLIAEGAEPGSSLTLRVRTVDDGGRPWSSAASFVADDRGRVDPSRAAPVSGTYAGVDECGLIWSMRPEPVESSSSLHERFPKSSADPLVLEISASVGGDVVAAASCRRLAAAPGVERVPVEEGGLVGTAFRPAGDGRAPGVLVLSGSGGALLECTAALLASHGFGALSLSYFGRAGLPGAFIEIPLEYLRAGLRWLTRQSWVMPGASSVVGTSLGGQAALLLASHWPDVRAVVGINASGVVFESIVAGGRRGPPWTRRGVPLDHVPVPVDLRAAAAATPEAPFVSAPAFERALEVGDRSERARVPIENHAPRVLLLSGADDGVWPSDALAERIVREQAGRGRAAAVEHVSYPEVGHVLGPPGLPSTGTLSFRGGCRALGGSARATARAEADAWGRILRFLGSHLPAG